MSADRRPGPRFAPRLAWGGLLAALLSLVLVLAAGCASTGLESAALPAQPLAFIYRTEEEAARRLEILERLEGKQPPSRPGHVRMAQVSEMLGLSRTPEQRRADSLGRLALLDPRSEEISIQRWALRGAQPLDWSPDHRRLLFASSRDGAPQLFQYDLDRGDLQRVTRGPHVHPTGCYGPDGRLAYQELQLAGADYSSRIVVTGPGGAAPRPVSPGPVDSGPVWSPDGRLLLYVIRAREREARIALVDLEAGSEPRLVARGRSPAFTADGAWVVYSSYTRKGWQLYRMRPDGSGKRLVGHGPGDAHLPAPSPDGRFVIYASEVEGRTQLRLRALDGSGDRPLIGSGEGVMPVWN